MTTAEFRKFESSRVIELKKGSYYRKLNLLGVKESLAFLWDIEDLNQMFLLR